MAFFCGFGQRINSELKQKDHKTFDFAVSCWGLDQFFGRGGRDDIYVLNHQYASKLFVMFFKRSPNGSQMAERRVKTHIMMQLESFFYDNGF